MTDTIEREIEDHEGPSGAPYEEGLAGKEGHDDAVDGGDKQTLPHPDQLPRVVG